LEIIEALPLARGHRTQGRGDALGECPHVEGILNPWKTLGKTVEMIREPDSEEPETDEPETDEPETDDPQVSKRKMP
jgi:hypothetical protein